MTPKKRRTSWIRIILKFFGYILVFIVGLLVLAYSLAAIREEKILARLNEKIQSGINGEFHAGGMSFTVFEDFPTFSISLSDIYLRGPRYDRYHNDVFNAEKIYINIQPLQLITGTVSLQSIKIRNANVFIFRTADGFTNMETFKKKDQDTVKTGGFKPTIDLQKIIFENTRLLYFDSIKRKSYGLKFTDADMTIQSTDSSKQLSIAGGIYFDGLMLKEAKGSYLKDKATQAKLNLEVVKGKSGFSLLPSELQFEKSTVQLSGAFKFEAPGSFVLNIHAPNLDYKEGTTIVTQALSDKLGKFNLDQPIDLKVRLDGSLSGGEPAIDMEFLTDSNRLELGKLKVSDLRFKGTFMNHVDETVDRGDPNSRFVLESFFGRISGIPTEGRVAITNLKNPDLDLDFHLHFALTEINERTDTTRLKFTSGQFKGDIRYQGQLAEYLDSTRTHYDGKLSGAVNVEDAALEMPIQQKKFDKGNVAIKFTSAKMDIEKANFNLNNSPVEVKGSLVGFLPFFFGPDKKGFVDLSVYSPRLDLTPLIKKKSKSNKPVVGSKKSKRISDILDMLYDKIEFNLVVRIDELIKDSFRATAVNGKMQLIKGTLTAGPISLKAAGGTASLTVKVSNLDKPDNDIRLTSEVKNADIKKYFQSFDNFGQKGITSEHLSGKLSTRIKLYARVDEQFKVQLPSLSGNVDFRIVDGRLQNYEPMQKLGIFVIKNRDFSDVAFAEIKSKVAVQGPNFDIERMEIQSSVLFMFIEGRYSLKDSTALSIQVPLKNLKKHDANYKPENVGTDAKVGASIFLFVHRNKDGKMAISYDPFKKHRKKKSSTGSD